jgi:putative Mn2+ efflux pump MntP
MNFFALLALGIALAMDAACVSMVNGMVDKRIRIRQALYIAFVFGFFQGAMALIGYLSGNLFLDLISGIDHWIALGLLAFIGGKMIYESVSNKDEEEAKSCDITHRKLFVQAVATSIDALAAGISIAALLVNMYEATALIFLTTFIISLISVYLGKKFGLLLSKKAELLGGLILLGIGLNIFISHITT